MVEPHPGNMYNTTHIHPLMVNNDRICKHAAHDRTYSDAIDRTGGRQCIRIMMLVTTKHAQRNIVDGEGGVLGMPPLKNTVLKTLTFVEPFFHLRGHLDPVNANGSGSEINDHGHRASHVLHTIRRFEMSSAGPRGQIDDTLHSSAKAPDLDHTSTCDHGEAVVVLQHVIDDAFSHGVRFMHLGAYDNTRPFTSVES